MITSKRMFVPGLATFLLVAAQGCKSPAEPDPATAIPAPDSPERIVATLGSETITVGDLERFVGRERNQGFDAETPVAERFAQLARRIAVERLLHAEALASGSDQDPALRNLDRHQQRLVYSQHFLGTLPPPEPITEEALRARFATVKPNLDEGEKRRVSHIFLRYGGPESPSEVRERLASIRQQIVDGQPFELLAREHSESETRHRNGLVGFVERGIFPPDFDEVVFSLAPGVPSEVLSTADGAHLLFVHNVLEARDVTFEDVREPLRRELQLERRFERLRQAAADLPVPGEIWTAERQQIPALLRQAPDARPLLRVGEETVLTLGELRQQLQSLAKLLGDLVAPELPLRLFDELQHREIIYQHLLQREAAGEDLAIPEAQLQAIHRRQLIEHQARSKMRELLESDSERLERYRAENALRFSTPLRFEIERLTVPAGSQGSAAMARLEQARDPLDAGSAELEDLARELGGRTERQGPLTLAQLAALDPPAVRFAPLLQPGEHSPPYGTANGEALTMFAVLQREEPRALPLEQVRERVIDDYLDKNTVLLFREVTEPMLAAAGFELRM